MCCGCPNPGGVHDQVGWSPGQPDPAGGVPAVAGGALGGVKVPSDPSRSVALRWVEKLHAALVGTKAGQSRASSCQSHCAKSHRRCV